MLRNRDLIIPGRHLGLTIEAREETEELISMAAKEVEEHVLRNQTHPHTPPIKGGE